MLIFIQLLNALNNHKLWAQNTSSLCPQLSFESDQNPFFTFNACFIATRHIEKIEVTVSKKPDFKTVKTAIELWVYTFDKHGQCLQLTQYTHPVKSSKQGIHYSDSTVYFWTYRGTKCIAERVLENSNWKSVYRNFNTSDSSFILNYAEELQNPFIKSSPFPYLVKNTSKDSVGVQWLSKHIILNTFYNIQSKPYKEIMSRFYPDGSMAYKSEHYFAVPWMRQQWQWYKEAGLLKRYVFTFQNDIEVQTERL